MLKLKLSKGSTRELFREAEIRRSPSNATTNNRKSPSNSETNRSANGCYINNGNYEKPHNEESTRALLKTNMFKQQLVQPRNCVVKQIK
jgi:hypothetical protein